MIAPIIAMQSSAPAASIQQNTEAQSTLQTTNAQAQIKEETRQVNQTVVKKDEAVFYQQNHDAKEEGRNKYMNLYSNKKKKDGSKASDEKSGDMVNRVNFDLKI
ncbi:MAG: hypothetical protein K2G45_03530 [Lachnospiraceae bacterium]|nr:hypothetical protein [Lachnospiraceae bacterium]